MRLQSSRPRCRIRLSRCGRARPSPLAPAICGRGRRREAAPRPGSRLPPGAGRTGAGRHRAGGLARPSTGPPRAISRSGHAAERSPTRTVRPSTPATGFRPHPARETGGRSADLGLPSGGAPLYRYPALREAPAPTEQVELQPAHRVPAAVVIPVLGDVVVELHDASLP